MKEILLDTNHTLIIEKDGTEGLGEMALRQQKESRRARVLHKFEYYQKIAKEVFLLSFY
jgi:hypothetical protein